MLLRSKPARICENLSQRERDELFYHNVTQEVDLSDACVADATTTEACTVKSVYHLFYLRVSRA